MSSVTTINMDTSYHLSEEAIASFRRDGYVRLKNVFSTEELAYWRPIFAAAVERQRAHLDYADLPIEERDRYSKSFLQIINIWQTEPETAPFVLGKRIADIAKQLIGSDSVRLYHDQALYKEPGGFSTPWHTDQGYWPMNTARTAVVWIPFHAVPIKMGPLSAALGTQNHTTHRELVISEDSERFIEETVRGDNYHVIEESYDLGEVSFHWGYCYHRALANKSDQMREVMTMIYMDGNMRFAPSKRTEEDAELFCPNAVAGEVIDSALTPVVA